MNISWYGQNCFRIITQKEKNGQVNILIDPFDKETGLRAPKLEADVLLVNSETKIPAGDYFLISGPGEYDLKGVYTRGIRAGSNTIYVIESEEMRVCHLGALDQKELTTDQLEAIGEVDVLMVPVGGGAALTADAAVKIISQIEPKITIPMRYKVVGLKEKLDGVDKFLKVLGIKSLAPVDKLSLKKKDVSEEEAKIVVLNP
jgi:L-ascorbate metabolism protein UlaG (beta-lactamase superfamily)